MKKKLVINYDTKERWETYFYKLFADEQQSACITTEG